MSFDQIIFISMFGMLLLSFRHEKLHHNDLILVLSLAHSIVYGPYSHPVVGKYLFSTC